MDAPSETRKRLVRQERLALAPLTGRKGETAMSNDRFERGLAKLKEVDGEAGERVMESLKDIAPDLARYIIEFAFGDVYSSPGLDLRSREIATVAALPRNGHSASHPPRNQRNESLL